MFEGLNDYFELRDHVWMFIISIANACVICAQKPQADNYKHARVGVVFFVHEQMCLFALNPTVASD